MTETATYSPELCAKLGRVYAFLMSVPDAKVPEAAAAKHTASGGNGVGASREKAHRRE